MNSAIKYLAIFDSGVVKHQTNLVTHPPDCEVLRNNTNTTSLQQGECIEAAAFEADEPQVMHNNWLISVILSLVELSPMMLCDE